MLMHTVHIRIFSIMTNKCAFIKYNKIQIVNTTNKYYPYMFQQWSAICRESTDTKGHYPTLHFTY